MGDMTGLDTTQALSNYSGALDNYNSAISVISKTRTYEGSQTTIYSTTYDPYIQLYSDFKEIAKKYLENFEYLPMLNAFEDLFKELDVSKMKQKVGSMLIIEEYRTWHLLSQLYYDRIGNIANNNESSIPEIQNSEQEAMKSLFITNKDVREAQIVVDWLQYFMKKDLDKNRDFLIGHHGKAWEHTKHGLKRKDIIMFHDKKISELDPDAPLRGALQLSDMDKNEENEYLKCLYHCLRANEYDKAKELCDNRGEFWRRITLDGWMPFKNPLLEDSGYSKDVALDELASMPPDISGNANRELFLNMCQKLSKDVHLNIYERAIYSLFSGNLQVLLSIEHNEWPHTLWAYFKVFINQHVWTHLQGHVNNGYLSMQNQSLFGDDTDDGFSEILPGLRSCNVVEDEHSMVAKSLDQLFDEALMANHYNFDDVLTIRLPSNNIKDKTILTKYYMAIFHVIQRCIITDKIEELMNYIELILPKITKNKSSESTRYMLRFLTHIVLFLYSIHEGLDIDLHYSVLEAYIECLVDLNYLDVLTFYISRLSTDLQIKWFSKCLKDVMDPIERERCIIDAVNYGLPVIETTCLVAKDIRINGYQTKSTIEQFQNINMNSRIVRDSDSNIDNLNRSSVSTITTGGSSLLMSSSVPNTVVNSLVKDEDRMYIDGLNWLTILTEQRPFLIRQVNALSRYFLNLSKYEAVKMTLSLVTEDTWDFLTANEDNDQQPSWLTNVLYEFQCIRDYVNCMDLYADWYKYFHSMRPKDSIIKLNPNSETNANLLSFQEKQDLQKKFEEEWTTYKQWESSVDLYCKRFFEASTEMLRNGKSGWLSNIQFDEDWKEEYDSNSGLSENDSDHCDNAKSRIRDSEYLRKNCIPKLVLIVQKTLYSSGHNNKSFELAELLANEQFRLYTVFPQKDLRKLLLDIRESSLRLLGEGRDCLGFDLDQIDSNN